MDVQSAANLNIPEGSVRNIHDKDKRLLWSAVGYNVRYDGDTTQQTYTGKNKMPMQSADLTNHRVEEFVIALPAGTYTYSFDLDSFEVGTNSSFSIYSQFYLSTETWKDNNISNPIDNTTPLGRKSYTFTLDADAIIDLSHKSNIRIPANFYNNGARASISNIMIEPGSTATTYEQYVGGIPAPNPDYPQDVNVVTGDQTVNITGKNLFSGYTKGIRINPTTGGVETNSTAASSDFIPLDLTGSNKAIFSGLPNTLYSLVAAYNSEKVFLGRTSAGNVGSRLLGSDSFTSGTPQGSGDVVFIRLSVYENSSAPGVIGDIDDANIQLELGDTATAYEPYQSQSYTVSLGSVELCKIGDYQDYIYKSGDDWYVHKAVGKSMLGNLTWTTGGTNQTNIYRMQSKGLSGTFIQPANNSIPLTGLCTHYLAARNDAQGTYGCNIGISGARTGDNIFIYTPDYNTSSSASDFTTWLSNNNVALYYALKTPTYTKITDNTLIGQLNAIHDWLTRYDYYPTVTGDLPIVINRVLLT